MRTVIIMAIFLLLSVSNLTGCNSTSSVTPVSATVEDAINQLLKTGSVFVPTSKMASELTGYSVAIPSFVPDGFVPVEPSGAGGSFNVFKLGEPSQIKGVEYPYSVNVIYSQTGEYSTNVPFFQITQSRNIISGPKGEPVQIGKHEGKKAILSDLAPPRLALTWREEVMYYSMEGLLLDPLDEDTLIKIASSMRQ